MCRHPVAAGKNTWQHPLHTYLCVDADADVLEFPLAGDKRNTFHL